MSSKGEDNEALAQLFRAHKERDVEFLLDALRDPKYRFMAVKFLGELRATEAVQPLIRLLNAGDSATKSSAARALADIGATEALPQLVERATSDGELAPRTWALDALGALGDERAVEPLCELLSDANILIRHAAAKALGVLGHRKALEALQQAVAREQWYDRRPYKKAIRRIRGRASDGVHERRELKK